LLETVRQYGRQLLLESGEEAQWQERHLAHFLQVAEEAETHLTGAEQQRWLERLEAEHDNLRAALEWSATTNADAGLRLAGALWRFWYVRGYLDEGLRRLSAALVAPAKIAGEVVAARAKALHGAAEFARQQGDYPAALALNEESLAIRRELGDRRGTAISIGNLGNLAYDQGDYATARARHEESLAIRREINDRWGIAASLNNLGIVASDTGDFATARALHEESSTILRELGDRWAIANSLDNLGVVTANSGDYGAARSLYEEGLAIRRELGDRQGIANSLSNLGLVESAEGRHEAARALHKESLAIRQELGDRTGIVWPLEGLAYVALALGGPRRAARIWGRVELLRDEFGSPLAPSERPRYERQLAEARAALGDDAAFESAWREGRAMTVVDIVRYAVQAQDADG
jgi:tetratricopeptide (TPR) repeat protein